MVAGLITLGTDSVAVADAAVHVSALISGVIWSGEDTEESFGVGVARGP